MDTLAVAVVSLTSFYIAYHTYGRWLSRSVFQLDRDAEVPSRTLQDDVDFVPTRKSVIFGHHFTSIAGTGPIVGPALAVFWGWLPALLWVVLGAIFIGAVHDFGALVVSLRNRGQTVGEVAGRLISPRARVLFLVVLFFSLTVVLAIFGLVIATIFIVYPSSVLSVWIAMPLAVLVGFAVRRGHLWLPAVSALALLYLCVYLGVRVFPIALPFEDAVFAWTLLLMGYCFLASVLPVWVLLQPRDFINSQQLFVTLLLLVIGLVVASVSGQAPLLATAPAVATTLPADAPPMFPFLFITVACGACSGFHCLVSSGTSSKQISNELDAQYVAFGSMLLEGALAVLVILACTAGLGMGVEADGETLLGRAGLADPLRSRRKLGRFRASSENPGLCGRWSEFCERVRYPAGPGRRRDCRVGRQLRSDHPRLGDTTATICRPGIGSHVSHRAADQQVRRYVHRAGACSVVGDRSVPRCRPTFRRLDPLAAVRSHQPVARRPGIHGHLFLPMAPRTSRHVRRRPHGLDVGHAGLGHGLESLSPGPWMVGRQELLLGRLRCGHPPPPGVDDRRSHSPLAPCQGRPGRRVASSSQCPRHGQSIRFVLKRLADARDRVDGNYVRGWNSNDQTSAAAIKWTLP